MGEQQSNPVLEILDTQQPFHENQKYPEDKLMFNCGVWHAYYHRHAPPYRFENEHGHFHIFHQVGNKQWTHVAALSIDKKGLAQKWFITNRWVTDEVWQEAEKVLSFFDDETEVEDLLLVERWLHAMVLLYQEELQQLLQQRDREIERLMKNSSLESVLNNRDYYILAEKEINLHNKLASVLID
jgi:hypothetical protein